MLQIGVGDSRKPRRNDGKTFRGGKGLEDYPPR
jgi:hypothetical protein